MPMGHWESFGDCISDMKANQGYSQESAEKVCGKIKSKFEKSSEMGTPWKETMETEVIEEHEKESKGGIPLGEVHKSWEFNVKSILESPRKVSGTFHIPVVDRQKEFITSLAVEKAIPDFMHLPILHDFHKERPLGLITKVMKVGDEFRFEALLKATSDVDDAWDKILKGEYGHLSIAGARTKASSSCILSPQLRTEPCYTDGIRLDSISAVNTNAINPLTSLNVMKSDLGEEIFDVTHLLYKAETTDSNLMHAPTDYAKKEDMDKSGYAERTATYGVQQSAVIEHSSAKQPIGVNGPIDVAKPAVLQGQMQDGQNTMKGPQSLEQKLDDVMRILAQLVETDKEVHSRMDKATDKVETGAPTQPVTKCSDSEVKKAEEPIKVVKEEPKEPTQDLVKAQLEHITEFEKAFTAKMDEFTKAITDFKTRLDTIEKSKVEKAVTVIPSELAGQLAEIPIGNYEALKQLKRS